MSARHTDRPPPVPARLWKIAAVTGAGAFMAMLDSTVANLALESIRADFGSTLPIVQWVATGYLIALAVSLPTAGWLGSRYGYGRVWAGALAAFVGASALCALVPGPLTLIAARLLQGLAGGLMVPAGQAVIGSIADSRQLGRLMGTVGLVVALGPAVGPALGGVLLEVASWRWLFWINVPIGLVALIAARGLVPAGSADAGRLLDRRGLALLGFGLPLLLYGAMGIGSAEATSITVFAVIFGALLASAFVLHAFRAGKPLLELRLLRRGVFAAAAATAGLTGANTYGGLLLLPLYLQLAAGSDTLETGLLLLGMGLGSAVALPLGGLLTDRYGPGPVILAGAGLLLLTTIPFLFPGAPGAVTLGALLVARGIGVAWAQMPAMTAAFGSATAGEMGDATALINIVQRIGGATGALGVVAVLARTGSDAQAYSWAFAVLAGLSTLTLLAGLMMRRQSGLGSQTV